MTTIKRKTNKSYFIAYMVILLAVYNGNFLTRLFEGSPLIIWRQLIWLIGLYILFKRSRGIQDKFMIKKVCYWYKLFFIIIFCLSLRTLLIQNYNLTRILFDWYYFSAGFPFILIGTILVQNRISTTDFYKGLFYIGLILSIGLIIDSQTGYFTEKYRYYSVDDIDMSIVHETGRYCFLAESPTVFGIAYSYCLFGTFMLISQTKRIIERYLYLSVALFYIAASYLTGSRQITYLLILMFAICFSFYFKNIEKRKTEMILFVLTLTFVIASAVASLNDQTERSYRFSGKLIDSDKYRISLWIQGVNQLLLSDDLSKLFFGNGVGYVSSKNLPGEIVGSNYENTYFVTLSNLGIMGICLILFPATYIARKMTWRHLHFFDIGILCFILNFIITCFLSPNGVYYSSLISLYSILGLFFHRNYFVCSNYKLNPQNKTLIHK